MAYVTSVTPARDIIVSGTRGGSATTVLVAYQSKHYKLARFANDRELIVAKWDSATTDRRDNRMWEGWREQAQRDADTMDEAIYLLESRLGLDRWPPKRLFPTAYLEAPRVGMIQERGPEDDPRYVHIVNGVVMATGETLEEMVRFGQRMLERERSGPFAAAWGAPAPAIDFPG